MTLHRRTTDGVSNPSDRVSAIVTLNVGPAQSVVSGTWVQSWAESYIPVTPTNTGGHYA